MRVVLADDAAIGRRVAQLLLERLGHRVVGVAADGAEAVRAVRELAPDLLVIDGRLPCASVVEVVRDVRSQAAGTRIAVVAALGELALVRACVAAGAHGAVRRPMLAPAFTAALAAIEAVAQ